MNPTRDPEATLLSIHTALTSFYTQVSEIEANTVMFTPELDHLGSALVHLENAAASVSLARSAMIETRGGIDRAPKLAAE